MLNPDYKYKLLIFLTNVVRSIVRRTLLKIIHAMILKNRPVGAIASATQWQRDAASILSRELVDSTSTLREHIQ